MSPVAVRALGAALAQRRMYPPEHPIASKALATLTTYLERILELVQEWRLALVSGKLLAAGRPVEEGCEGLVPFVEGLKARGIETIVFKRGVGVEELRRFISLMLLDPKRVSGRGLQELMANEGIVSIEAGRLVLEDQGEAEKKTAMLDETGPELLEAYDNGLTFIEETIRSLREGRKISMEEAESFVTTIARQMHEDRSPFLILTALKSHHA